METVRVIDPHAATALLTELRDMTWTWRRDDLTAVAQDLRWTNLEIVKGRVGEGAFADAPVSFGGEEVQALIRDGHVAFVSMRVSDRAPGDTNASVAAVHRSWLQLVRLATGLFGPPTRTTAGRNPDAQWRGPQATVSVVDVRIAVVLYWAHNAYQDWWNTLDAD